MKYGTHLLIGVRTQTAMADCSSCGSPIGNDQGSSCSMCYGDPYHGTDGYYLDYLEQQYREAEQRHEDEQRHAEEQHE